MIRCYLRVRFSKSYFDIGESIVSYMLNDRYKNSQTRTRRYWRLLCAYEPLVKSSRTAHEKRLTDETDITGFAATKGLKKSLRYVKKEIDLATS